MEEFQQKIRDFGRKANWKSCNKYLTNQGIEEVINLVKIKINHPDFESLWTYLLRTYKEDENSHGDRFKMVLCCLESLQSQDVSSTTSEAVISRLCLELFNFHSNHLVDLCRLCLEFIQKGGVNEACWSVLLPKLLSVIVKKELIENQGEEMSGLEYKTQVIKALIFMEWSANIIIPLTIMFSDMTLTKEEHFEVTNKLGKYTEKLTPQEIPTFTYNLLKLCRHQNNKLIFFCLQHYFGTRIYSTTLECESNSESLDLISTTNDDELLQTQSTVLYHIQQCALLSHESLKEYFNFIKTLTRAPEFLLHPFQLTVLLSISTISIHKTVVFAIIKQAIVRMLQEEIKREESSWLKTMISESFSLNSIFDVIIEKSVKNCELVLHGLVNLCFVLLGASPLLGRESRIVSKQWDLGKSILLKLIKREVQIAPSVLKRLCEEIVTYNSTFQYSDCFFGFSKQFPVLILENKGYILQMLESLILCPGNVSEQVLEAVVPLTKPSPTLRDHLILLLRKGLHSRTPSSQTIAIKGFLKLLTILKISNLTSLTSQLAGSQSSSSGLSVLTQISMNCTVHTTQGNIFSNEALCLEVLGILKRCFTQPYAIKCKLYEGLSEVVSRNSEISEAVLDLLWNYFISKYYVSDENVCPPIKFNEVFVTREIDVVLEEPIGKLLFTISLITNKVLKRDDQNLTAKKIVTALNSIVERMGRCELVHFELDDGTFLLDVLPEAKSKVFVLAQAMTVYEALIGYRIVAWEKKSENYAQDINTLFQGYFRLQRCAMDAHKSKKEDRKKKDGNKTGNDQINISSTSKINTSTQNDSNSTKTGVKSSKHIKIPESIFNFKVVKKFLKILHCNVEFIPTLSLNQIKSKSEIHRHVMQSTINLVQSLKKSKHLSTNQKIKDYKNCLNVAKIIYKRCLERMDEFVDFDPVTTVLAADCFQIILKLVCTRYNDDLSKFLCEVADLNENKTEFLGRINVFIEKYQELFEADFTAGTGDVDGRKLQLIVLLTLEILIHELPDEATLPSNKFLDWIKTYSTQNTISTKPIVSTFLNLWFTSYVRFKSSLAIFEEIVDNLLNTFGSITQDTQGVHTFELINEATTHTFIEKISIILKMMFDHVDLVINRLKSEYSILMYPNVQSLERRKENLKNKERGISCYLCLLITILDSVCTILVPIGNLSEAVLKNIISLYNCLNTCAKYFLARSSNINPAFQSARFDSVIKLAGRQLSPSVNKFIFYLEETQKENESEVKKKKKSNDILKNKVLYETKSIPKVVYLTEQFSRLVTQLSKKTKIDVFKYIGLGTTRDFRIKDINTVLKKSIDDTDVTDESLQESVVEEENDNEVSMEDVESNSEGEKEEPPLKKMRQ
nr:Fanconi anemia group I protein-like [Onthophagus taurus]